VPKAARPVCHEKIAGNEDNEIINEVVVWGW
jgi:hypothetical protein